MAFRNAFREKKDEIESRLTISLIICYSRMLSASMQQQTGQTSFSDQQLHDMFTNIMQSADKQEGGFGSAPKFPQTFTIQYLLRYYHYYKEPGSIKTSLP